MHTIMKFLKAQNLLQDSDGLDVFALTKSQAKSGTSDWNCLAESSSFLSSAIN